MSIYWDEHTKKTLSETLNKVLIVEHADELESDFITLLDSRYNAQISGIYNLMNRDSTLLPKLVTIYEEYVKNLGKNANKQLLAQHSVALISDQNQMNDKNSNKRRINKEWHEQQILYQQRNILKNC